MKGIFESQKLCHGEEVKNLFSEALEEPVKGQREGARIFSASFIPFQSEIGLTQELRRVVGKEGG